MRKYFSIRVYIYIPFIIMFSLFTVFSVWFSIKNTSAQIDQFVETYSSTIADSAESQLADFLSLPIKHIEDNINIFNQGFIALDDHDQITQLFLRQIETRPYHTVISIGYPDGKYIGASRDNAKELILYQTLDEDKGRLNRYQVDENFKKVKQVHQGNFYNPTERHWFILASEKKSTTWYPVYKYASLEGLGIGVSSPLLDPRTGDILAVITSDLSLSQLSSFIEKLDVGENGFVFIAETTGELVALSLDLPIYFRDNEYIRHDLTSVEDFRLNQISQLGYYEIEDNLKGNLTISDEEYYYHIRPYRDSYGQNMIIGVVLSYEDFVSAYQSSANISLIILLFSIFILAVVIVGVVDFLVIPPINQLASAYSKVKSGDFNVSIPLYGSQELVELSNGFNALVKTLERSKALEQDYLKHERLAFLGALVSGITHDINTPLGAAITVSSYMSEIHHNILRQLDEGSLTKEELITYINDLSESLSILSSNLGQSADLIKSFKGLAAGQSNEQAVDFMLCELVTHVINSLKHEYKKKNHTVHFDCNDYILLYSYPSAFTQIFTNLMMNSLIHGFKNKKQGEVYIGIRVVDDFLIIDYRDNGEGMDEKTQENIYKAFYTTNRAGGGTGIGMSVVHKLVTEKLKGTIHLKSEVGEGAAFKIKIPRS